MSFIVVKNAAGEVVASGPDDGNYAPGCPPGGSLETVAQQPGPNVAAMKEAELSKFRADRELFLNRLAGIGLAAQFEDRSDAVASVVAVRKGLLALTSLPAVTGAADLDALKAAMKTAYAALLVGVPAEVKAAFKGVDA